MFQKYLFVLLSSDHLETILSSSLSSTSNMWGPLNTGLQNELATKSSLAQCFNPVLIVLLPVIKLIFN